MLNLTDKKDLRRGRKSIALSNLSIYYTWKNIKKSYNNNKFKISTPTWNDKSELTDGSYFVSYIQDYFEYIVKKHKGKIDNTLIRIYGNKIENRITFKTKAGHYLELLTPGTMKLHGSTKNKITKDINGENVPHQVINEVCIIKYLLEIAPTNFIFLEIFNSELSYIEVWFTDKKKSATTNRRQNQFNFSY